ncbi:MAG: hypothetical protein ABIQ15_15540 [Nocardioides sp.]
MRAHHRPTTPGAGFFEAIESGTDPVQLSEAADRAATLLVRGARDSPDGEIAERVLHLADAEGLETLAELWSGSAADSLAGALWRLYLLRTWVYADPVGAAHQFEAGQARAEVARVVAGVADPPGPDELRAMVDEVLRGIAERDFADVLLRAAAFARVVATGRAALPGPTTDDTARMLTVAEQLERAAHLELGHGLA